MCLPGYTLLQQHMFKPNKNVLFVSFFIFPVAHIMHVFNHTMVGLVINPVYRPISQQPGPIKMRQATRYLWSYIRNYIGYIISVYTPLQYHRMRAICSSSGIMYMGSIGSIWLYLQYQITQSCKLQFTC